MSSRGKSFGDRRFRVSGPIHQRQRDVGRLRSWIGDCDTGTRSHLIDENAGGSGYWRRQYSSFADQLTVAFISKNDRAARRRRAATRSDHGIADDESGYTFQLRLEDPVGGDVI